MGKAKEFICQKPQLGLTCPRYCSLMETGQIALNSCYLLAQRFMDPGAIGPAYLKPPSLGLSLPGCTLMCLRCGVWFPTLARVA